jgi:hypothetical protein
MSFKAGDYIVVLKKPNGNYNYFKLNFIFKQDLDIPNLFTSNDIRGEKTSCYDVVFDKKDIWRYATPQEIQEYERIGKPYDVTTLIPKDINYEIY